MAFNFPDNYRFADSHEYAVEDSELIKIGISEFAVDQLGDIVFVDLPDKGSKIEKSTVFGSVESVKAVEDMYAPMTGVIEEVNESVLSSPEALQSDPHGEGWLLKIRPEDLDQLNLLMDSNSYKSKVAVK